MSDEKPLRVQVAEALGWTITLKQDDPKKSNYGESYGCPPGKAEGIHVWIPPYGEDSPEGWACTGPLLERCKGSEGALICVPVGKHVRVWYSTNTAADVIASAPSVPEAIARCVVALAAAGKLEQTA